MEKVEPVQKNIYQSNTYRKDLSWQHLDDEEGQLGAPAQTWQQYYIQGRMVDLQRYRATSRERNFIERIKDPIFLEAVLATEIM